MKKSNIPYNVLQLKKMFEKSRILDFDCPIQRRFGMWDEYRQGLLIHSMLVGFIIPPIYMTKEYKGSKDAKGREVANYSCIDGQHRLRSIFNFVNDEYPIHEDIPDVDIDGETYEIAGKKFSELPAEIQKMIESFMFTIYNLEECTDDEIEEMFFRLNNGSGLSKTQIANVKLGMNLASFIKQIIGGKFFTESCHFTGSQIRRAADEKTLIQAMLLLDVKYEEYELVSISEGEVIHYAEAIHDDYSEEKKARLLDIIKYLEEAFDKKEKFLKVINIPIFIYVADTAMKSGVSSEKFYEWFKEFADAYNPDCEYAQYCSTGSIKKEKTLKRIEVMEKSFKEFINRPSENNEETEADENGNETEVKENIENPDA